MSTQKWQSAAGLQKIALDVICSWPVKDRAERNLQQACRKSVLSVC
jgi:hypothetical protein